MSTKEAVSSMVSDLDCAAEQVVSAVSFVSAAAEAYDRVVDQYDCNYLDAKSRAEDRMIFGMLQDGKHLVGDVLDVGCGTGSLLDHRPLSFDRYLGCDPSLGMLERASRKFPKHVFFRGSCEDLRRVSGSSVDSIVCLYGSFSYCLDPVGAMEEFARVLRPGGRLFVMACGESHSRRGSYLLRKVGLRVERRLYTESTLRNLFAEYFDQVQLTGFGWALDHLPLAAPDWVFNTVLAAEMGTVGKVAPNLCCYMVVTARKPE